ncbi:TPA: L-alanine exporter AlaE [Raoultella ornithinolytica]|nr:L-alanine exporter AlaE [Raoultella ornithinolytica]HAT1671164.1 L-alanine exporter AlaE [Raoultella ornithinolytica]
MCADMFAMASFCTVVNMIIEIYISGLSFNNSLETRLIALPINMIIALPYGKYRDFILNKLKVWSVPQLLSDTFSYATLLSPVYAAILIFMGDDVKQIISAVVSNVVVCILTGGVYGLYMDVCRKIIGVKSLGVSID